MNVSEMQIANPVMGSVTDELNILQELLPLQGAKVLELGCGKAEKTRLVAQQVASVLALEVDEIQLANNMQITDLPNVSFKYGVAEKIAAPDAAFDIVLMFKSLHHVPIEQMDNAFAEIHRVLKPGGLAYISEPVFAGDFNEVLRLFHDESTVREAAFAAVKRAVASNKFSLVTQKFFLSAMHFDSFKQFEEQVLKVTHTEHKLSAALHGQVREKFSKHLTPYGADFQTPIRVDLLGKKL
jgi:ubiquinone/menaquinone biosynthesis C-methylase UbiE